MASSVYIDKLRQHNVEAYQKRGLALVVRKAWQPRHLDSGDAIPCPDCWEPAYKQSSNTNCPRCTGTGVVGLANGEGYQEPVFTWGNIILQNEGFSEVSREGAGDWNAEGGQSTMCHTPVLEPGDLIFLVDDFAHEIATVVSGLCEVTGAVQYFTMRGSFFGISSNTFNLTETLLYQSFNVKVIPSNDTRQSLGFFSGGD